MSEPDYLEVPAPPPLDTLIHCFWFLRGPMAGAGVQTVVPDGRIEIVLHLAEPFSEVDAAGVARPQAEALLAGQLTAPILLLPGGRSDVVGIRFRSAAARCVLGFPVSEISGRVARLADHGSRLAGELLTAASRHRLPADRTRALASVLLRFVREEPQGLVDAAVRSFDAPRPPTVGRVARQLGVDRRTLERRILREVGLSPRMLLRVLRFRRAFGLLDRAPPGHGARMAAAAGYYDQAHLIRDFRRFAGATPSAFLESDPALARALASGGTTGV